MPLPGEPVPVPSDATMAALGLREEALRTVDVSTRARHWEAAFDYVFANVNGRRITRPIVSLHDVGLLGFIVRIGDAETLGWTRGFKPTAGQDGWIVAELTNMRADLDRLSEGTWRPLFTDSTPPNQGEPMGPLGGTDAASDTWATRAGCGTRCFCQVC